MRNSCVLLVALFLLSATAVAQNTPWWELYGGYQFTRADIGAAQDAANAATTAAGLPGLDVGRNLNMKGWNASRWMKSTCVCCAPSGCNRY